MQLIERPQHRDWQARISIPEEFRDRRDNTHLKIHVEYTKGGMNYFSGTTNARGYRVSWRRVKYSGPTVPGGFSSESFSLFGDEPLDSGYVMLESAERYNAKQLRQWATNVDAELNDLVTAILARDKARVLTIVHARLGAELRNTPSAPAPVVVKPLLTDTLRQQLLANGHSSQQAVCKFFNPAGNGTWIISGMDKDGDTLWCLADLGMGCAEQGTASLKELQETRLPMGLHIERDLHFEPRGRSLSDFSEIYNKRGTLVGVC